MTSEMDYMPYIMKPIMFNMTLNVNRLLQSKTDMLWQKRVQNTKQTKHYVYIHVFQ